VATSLSDSLDGVKEAFAERTLCITYFPLSVFRVRPITRCTASLAGHTEAILCVAFSPDGTQLASGSGDTTVRLWDLFTETPAYTLKGHTNWVLCVSWASDGSMVASAGMDGSVRVWDPLTGTLIGSDALRGHSKAVCCLEWQPLHLVNSVGSEDIDRPRLASASKDSTIRIWDVIRAHCLICLSSHTNHVTQIRWSGEPQGFLYSASRDTTIRVWDPSNGMMIKELKGHGHWVNTLALNTERIIYSGPFDHEGSRTFSSGAEMKAAALRRYEEGVKTCGAERLLSGSDDFTMFLWDPQNSRKPICRMTGHQKVVNHVCFSPDGRYIISGSFDKSIRLWDGRSGKYMATFRGHVGSIYQLSWSMDSRMFVSCSADSTVKLWDVATRKLKEDLPGHCDEVYALMWSSDGARVASGSKDRTLRIWRH